MNVDLTKSPVLTTNLQETEGSEELVKQYHWGTASHEVQVLGYFIRQTIHFLQQINFQGKKKEDAKGTNKLQET